RARRPGAPAGDPGRARRAGRGRQRARARRGRGRRAHGDPLRPDGSATDGAARSPPADDLAAAAVRTVLPGAVSHRSSLSRGRHRRCGRGGGAGGAGRAGMRGLRLLHLVANRWWTGNAEPAVDLARALQARGHAVWFACVPGDVLAAGLALAPGLTLERTARPWRLAREIAAVRRVLRERRIDLVHAHQTHDHWIAGLARGPHPAR